MALITYRELLYSASVLEGDGIILVYKNLSHLFGISDISKIQLKVGISGHIASSKTFALTPTKSFC